MAHEAGPRSPNLEYRRVAVADADELHAMIVEDHVKRYLCDGETLPRAWADETIAAAESLYRGRGVGLWLLHEPEVARPLGFCGFFVFPGFDGPRVRHRGGGGVRRLRPRARRDDGVRGGRRRAQRRVDPRARETRVRALRRDPGGVRDDGAVPPRRGRLNEGSGAAIDESCDQEDSAAVGSTHSRLYQ
jgi:hypothetical protein